MSNRDTTTSTTTRQYDKRNIIIVGSILGIVVLGTILFQAGFSAGSASVSSTAKISSDNSQEVKNESEQVPREPIVLSGTGQQATDPIDLVAGLATVKMKHSGDSNFSVWVLDKYADKVELLVNEIVAFDGSKAFQVPADGRYTLDISADGAWEITIKQ